MLKQEMSWDAAIQKYHKIENNLYKIVKKTRRSNDYTVSKLIDLLKENREFEYDLINMKKEMTDIMEKLKKECTIYSEKKKQPVPKNIKIQTSTVSSEDILKDKKGNAAQANQENNLRHNEDSMDSSNSELDNFIDNISISDEIKQKEEQFYKTINWAYEEMKMFGYNIRKPENLIQHSSQLAQLEKAYTRNECAIEQRSEEINTRIKNIIEDECTIHYRKGVLLEKLKLIHQQLKDELKELQERRLKLDQIVQKENANTKRVVTDNTKCAQHGKPHEISNIKIKNIIRKECNIHNRKSKLLDKLKFMHQKLKDELEELQRHQDIKDKIVKKDEATTMTDANYFEVRNVDWQNGSNTKTKNVIDEDDLQELHDNKRKSIHQKLKIELEELQKNKNKLHKIVEEEDANNIITGVNKKEYFHVKAVVGMQLEVFSEFMKEVLSRLTSIYNLTTEDFKCDLQHKAIKKEETITKSSAIESKNPNIFNKLRDTCDVMKKLFLSITNMYIENNVDAAFKEPNGKSNLKETYDSIQHILNRIIFIHENLKAKKESLANGLQGAIKIPETHQDPVQTNIKLSTNEVVGQIKETYENLEKICNRTIQNLKDDKLGTKARIVKNNETVFEQDLHDTSDKKSVSDVSKIPVYHRNNNSLKCLPDNLDIETKSSTNMCIENTKNNTRLTAKSQENILKQVNSTYETSTSSKSQQDLLKQVNCTKKNLTSECKRIKPKIKKDHLLSRTTDNNIKESDKSYGDLIDLNKIKLEEQEIKRSNLTVKDVLKRLKHTYENMKTEYKAVARNVNNTKLEDKMTEGELEQSKKEVLHQCRKIVENNQYFSKKIKNNINTDICKWKNMRKDVNRIRSFKKLNWPRRSYPKLKYYYTKDDSAHFTQKVCGHFVVKHTEKEKSVTPNKKEKLISSNENSNNNKTKTSNSTYETIKNQYNQVTIDKQNFLKKIDQIGENINYLKSNVKNEKGDDKIVNESILKELSFIYNDLTEKYYSYIIENDILTIEIATLESDKQKIEQDINCLDAKIRKFKGNELKHKSDLAMKILLNDLETGYEDLKQNYCRSISSKQTKLQEKMTKVIQNKKNMEHIINSVEKRLKKYKLDKINREMSDIELKLKTKFSKGKSHQLTQLINSYEKIKSDYENFINYSDKISEKNPDTNLINKDVTNKLKILNRKEKDKLKKKPNIFKSDYEPIKEEQIQTTDDKEIQIHIDDSINNQKEKQLRRMLEIIHLDVLPELPEIKDIFKTQSTSTKRDLTVNVDKNEKSFSIQTEEMNDVWGGLHIKTTNKQCSFIQTEKTEENKIITEDRLNLKIYKSQSLEIQTTKNIFDLKDETIKKIEQQPFNLDTNLNDDMIEKRDNVIKLAEDQLDRIKEYLITFKRSGTTKTNEGSFFKNPEPKIHPKLSDINNLNALKLNPTLEQINKRDLKTLSTHILHESWPKPKISKKNDKGDESGDKSIHFNKLKVIKLPNQNIYDYKTVDNNNFEKENNSCNDVDSVKSEQDVLKQEEQKKVMEKTYPIRQNDHVTNNTDDDTRNVETNEIKMILNEEKETFKELKQVLAEKSNILENINDVLKRLLKTKGNSKLKYKREDNETQRNSRDKIIRTKQKKLRIVNLPSQNLYQQQHTYKSETSDVNCSEKLYVENKEAKVKVSSSEMHNFKSDTSNIECYSETLCARDEGTKLQVSSFEKLTETKIKDPTDSDLPDKYFKNTSDNLTTENIFKTGANLIKQQIKRMGKSSSNTGLEDNNMESVPVENKISDFDFQLQETKSNDIFKLEKENADLNLEACEFGDQFENQLLTQQEFADCLRNTQNYNQVFQSTKIENVGNNLIYSTTTSSINNINIMMGGKLWFDMVNENEAINEEEAEKVNKKSWTNLEKQIYAVNQIKDDPFNNNTANSLKIESDDKENETSKILKPDLCDLKGNIIFKDEVSSLVWDTVIEQGCDISFCSQETLSHSEETAINDWILDENTSFNKNLFLKPSKKTDEKEKPDDKIFNFVEKQTTELNKEDIENSSQITLLDNNSEETFLQLHNFEK